MLNPTKAEVPVNDAEVDRQVEKMCAGTDLKHLLLTEPSPDNNRTQQDAAPASKPQVLTAAQVPLNDLEVEEQANRIFADADLNYLLLSRLPPDKDQTPLTEDTTSEVTITTSHQGACLVYGVDIHQCNSGEEVQAALQRAFQLSYVEGNGDFLKVVTGNGEGRCIHILEEVAAKFGVRSDRIEHWSHAPVSVVDLRQ